MFYLKFSVNCKVLMIINIIFAYFSWWCLAFYCACVKMFCFYNNILVLNCCGFLLRVIFQVAELFQFALFKGVYCCLLNCFYSFSILSNFWLFIHDLEMCSQFEISIFFSAMVLSQKWIISITENENI